MPEYGRDFINAADDWVDSKRNKQIPAPEVLPLMIPIREQLHAMSVDVGARRGMTAGTGTKVIPLRQTQTIPNAFEVYL